MKMLKPTFVIFLVKQDRISFTGLCFLMGWHPCGVMWQHPCNITSWNGVAATIVKIMHSLVLKIDPRGFPNANM